MGNKHPAKWHSSGPAKLLWGLGFTLVLLVLVELALWLAPGFQPVPLVQEFDVGGQTYASVNPEFSRHVLQRENVEVDHRTWLPGRSPAGTLRVAFLGESAAAGYPSPDFSLARLVTVLWNDRHPERPMQSANFTSVGINSHVLRVFAREAAKLGPDAVVVYAGNNEAIGPYGPGSVWGRQMPSTLLAQAGLAVRNTRIGIALAKAMQALPFAPTESKSWRSLDEFKDAKIPADSPAVTRMATQSQDNFQAIARTSRAAGAKVLLCTPAVNLADWPPLASEHSAGKSASETFQKAREAERAGRRQEALALYRQARDLDLFRLRADSHVRNAIERAVAASKDPNVALLDADRRLHEENAGPLGDRELFLEHVHLTFEARVALAEMIIEQLEQMLLGATPGQLSPDEWWAHFPSKLAQAEEILLFTDFDRMDMSLSIERLLDMDIFQGSPGLSERRASLAAQAGEFAKTARAEWNVQSATDAYELAKTSPGCDDMVHATAGKLFETIGARDEALAAYRQALRLRPNNTHARLALVRAALATGSLDQADELLDVDYLDPRSPGLARLKGELFAKQRRYMDAATWLRQAVRENPSDGDLLRNLASVQQQAGMTEEAIENYRIIAKAAPNDAYTLNNLAWLLVEEQRPSQERRQEALSAARQAIKIQPDEAYYWGTYARVLAANEMRGEAVFAANKATELARRQNKPETVEAMRKILEPSGGAP